MHDLRYMLQDKFKMQKDTRFKMGSREKRRGMS